MSKKLKYFTDYITPDGELDRRFFRRKVDIREYQKTTPWGARVEVFEFKFNKYLTKHGRRGDN